MKLQLVNDPLIAFEHVITILLIKMCINHTNPIPLHILKVNITITVYHDT